MPNPIHTTQIDRIAERVELLLLRHAQALHTNAALAEQVSQLTQERDSLRSRLSAARARVEALIERLPDNGDTGFNPSLDTTR